MKFTSTRITSTTTITVVDGEVLESCTDGRKFRITITEVKEDDPIATQPAQ